jgi:glyoxylase-like metal-dependent hydrolase (beta-lactamase superfamily II)
MEGILTRRNIMNKIYAGEEDSASIDLYYKDHGTGKPVNRRTFLQRAGLAGISLLGFTLSPHPATADRDPPPDSAQAASAHPSPEADVFTFPFGGEDAFIIHDGALTLPGIQPVFAPEAKKEQVEALLKQNYLPLDHVTLSVNVLVLKSKSGVMLFDAGAGTAFGPATGKLLRGLARIGIGPADVKTIFITHAHPDHVCGLVDASWVPVFPSAGIIAAKTEVDFWTSENPDLSGIRVQPENRDQILATIKKTLAAVKANLELKSPGKVSPQVELIPAPGHTPGHSLFKVSQGDDNLLVMGDAVHVFALQFPHPEWTMAYDTYPAQAVKTRRKLFKDEAADRITLLGAHMPFPGIGHVRKAKQGYEWVARPWAL